MSIHIPATPPQNSDSDSFSSSSDEDDQNWEDWISDSATKPCKSLFDDAVFPSAAEALQYDKSVHQFDLDDVCSKLCM